MKRLLSFVLSICLLMALAGCHDATNTPVQTAGTTEDPAETTADTTVSVGQTEVFSLPFICLSIPTVTQSVQADDGTEVFRDVHQTMSLVLPEQETADRIIIDFLNRIEQVTGNTESLISAAKAVYHPDNWTPYLSQITYAPARFDTGVLSLTGSYVSYAGSSHPETADLSVSYDLVTGDVIKLADIIPATAVNVLVKEITASLDKQADTAYLFDDYADAVQDRFAGGLAHETQWYFGDTGLCFYFSAYEIAPYSTGVVTAEVPYEKLAGIMDDAYFPAERINAGGKLSVTHYDKADLEAYNQFAEIVLDKGKIKALLSTDSNVYDVRIDVGQWNAEGTEFTSQHTVFAAYALSAGDGIVVETDIADTASQLQIRYRSGGTTVCRYLTDSGKDGSLILSE